MMIFEIIEFVEKEEQNDENKIRTEYLTIWSIFTVNNVVIFPEKVQAVAQKELNATTYRRNENLNKLIIRLCTKKERKIESLALEGHFLNRKREVGSEIV